MQRFGSVFTSVVTRETRKKPEHWGQEWNLFTMNSLDPLPRSKMVTCILDGGRQLCSFHAFASSSSTGQDHDSGRTELCSAIQELYNAIEEAERYEIAQSGCEIILCTCIEAGGSRVKRHARVSHLIIDEASMCLEAETLVALSAAGQQLQQVVLLGDHKQLGAIVSCSVPRKLGLGKSLFETLFDGKGYGKSYSTCMLQTQYRMVSGCNQDR